MVDPSEASENTDPSSDDEERFGDIENAGSATTADWQGGDADSGGGEGGIPVDLVVNLGHRMIRSRSSGILILFLGSHSKMRRRMESSSGDKGKMELRNLGFFKYARKVESSMDARFHGFRPQVRFTRIMPKLQTSLGPDA
ncbi:MAG: hypothetical protein Q9207_007711 [Kuettlingeria erythrocarpa]